MYSSGIGALRSSKTAAPSTSSKSESATWRTWRATAVPTSWRSITPACTSASPKLRRSVRISAETRLKSSSVMRPSATSASPSRSRRRLLAANTSRPWSKKAILTMRPARTCRSPLRRSAESRRIVSEIGLWAMSVSIGRLYCARRGGRQAPGARPRVSSVSGAA